jgi:hypothetical protein
MERRIQEYREFFDEVVRTLALMEEAPEEYERATPEDKARWEHEANQAEGELRGRTPESLEYTPAELRQRIAGASADQLLGLRRVVAAGICVAVVRGRTHTDLKAEGLKDALHDLGMLDAEVERRHLDRG